jgi:lysophospholipase L1-like esterase
LTCATGSFSNQNFSALSVWRYNDQGATQANGAPAGPNFQLDISSGNSCSIYSDSNLVHQASPIIGTFIKGEAVFGGGFPSTGTSKSMRCPNTSFVACSNKNNGATAPIRFGNWRNQNLSTVNNSATGLTGFKLGVSFGTTFPAAATITAFVVGTALGSTDEQAGLDTLAAAWSLSNTPTVLLATEGDSITAGHQTSTSWPNRRFSWFNSVASSIGNKATCFNMAYDGGWLGLVNTPWGPMASEGAGTASVQQGGEAPDSLDPLLDSGQFAKQVLIVFMGRNDITLFGSGGPAGFGATIHTQLNTYCTARRAAGWKVIVLDAIPGQDMLAGQMPTEWTSFNSLIAANWASYADKFVQVSVLNWQPGGSSDWSTNYQDGVHPNVAGQAMIAAAVLPAVQALTSTFQAAWFTRSNMGAGFQNAS